MTEKELKEYKSLCQEIESLDKRMKKVREKEVEVVSGKVKASMSSFPYIETRIGVQMYVPEQIEAQNEVIKVYQERKAKAEAKKLEIEQYIDEIEDSQLRLIFQYRYIDGMKQSEIAKRVHIERSYVSKKIYAYLQLSHNSQKNVV